MVSPAIQFGTQVESSIATSCMCDTIQSSIVASSGTGVGNT